MQLFISRRQVEYIQQYQILVKVAAMAMGGGSNSTEIEEATPKTAAQAQMMIANLQL